MYPWLRYAESDKSWFSSCHFCGTWDAANTSLMTNGFVDKCLSSVFCRITIKQAAWTCSAVLIHPFWLRFSWRRNGKFFNIGKDPRVTMRKRSGTLEIGFRSGGRPEDYEGEYQCFATNDFGQALSNKILLRVSSKSTLNACAWKHRHTYSILHYNAWHYIV